MEFHYNLEKIYDLLKKFSCDFMSESERYSRAEKIVDEKIGFYHHLYSYIIVNVILAVINILFSPDHWWFIWVSFFWGIGLVTHFVRTHIFAE